MSRSRSRGVNSRLGRHMPPLQAGLGGTPWPRWHGHHQLLRTARRVPIRGSALAEAAACISPPCWRLTQHATVKAHSMVIVMHLLLLLLLLLLLHLMMVSQT